MLLLLTSLASQAQAQTWSLFAGDIKVVPEITTHNDTLPELHAARGEYVPLQIMLTESEAPVVPQVTSDNATLEITVYAQEFFPITEYWFPSEPSQAWIAADGVHIADRIAPLTAPSASLPRVVNGTSAAWVDIFVPESATAGTYTITVTVSGESRDVPLTIYDFTLPESSAMTVLMPLDDGSNISYFGEQQGMVADAYHAMLIDILADHYVVPGEFVADPEWTGSSWDFSAFTPEIERYPVGTVFHAPSPFDLQTQQYVFLNEGGAPYTASAFGNPYFEEQLDLYLTNLRDYLVSIGRFEDALLYPTDETFWVADEPDNNGPAGYERLRLWSERIFAADMGVMGSRVFPVSWGSNWLDPSLVVTDTHVPIAYLDAAPELFSTWAETEGNSYSVYSNLYGDLINMSAAMNRGVLWHSYARGARTVAGYAVLEWYTDIYDFMTPLNNVSAYTPHFGYGSGALIYPDGTASLRLKLWREGVEDARLLDAYAAQGGDASAFALCLTPQDIDQQNPNADVWINAHTALLEAVSTGTMLNLAAVCPPAPDYSDTLVLHDPETTGMSEWEFDGLDMEIVATASGEGMRLATTSSPNSAFYWYGGVDWSGYTVLELDIISESPYFTDLDVAVGDGNGEYMLFNNTSQIVAPNTTTTLTILLDEPPLTGEVFDFSEVNYIELAIGTSITRRDIRTQELYQFPLGNRTIVIDQIRLGR